ncbi:hypothetical protein CHS0354_006097 [Potamilus streckersoni]|uniref:Bromo domain-containing protein n=1 Tax=Potamilus streckersoni TaxID=2493646 RepID=A0AAE0ST46_9BIVA|nr:hypothetical protein CHS0354_006097 [Potamilus streckersoni]
MAVPLKLKKVPLDVWSVKEKLALACSVKRSGDQNWVSVSRAIKPFGDPNRPPDWFSQKNCAVQYAELLEQVETPKRKRGDKEKEAIDTPGDQIVRKLVIEHIEELKRFVQEEQQRYKKLKREVELIKSGQWDDRLQDVWEEMQREKREKEEKAREAERKAEEEVKARAQALALRRVQKLNRNQSASSLSEFDESTQDSINDQVNIETDDESLAPSTPTISALSENIPPIKIEIPPNVTHEVTKPMPPTSPLLSSLLQSKHKSVDDLQQIKAEAEAEHAAALQASQQAAAAASTATAAAATAIAMTTTSASTIMPEVPSLDPEVPTSPAPKSPPDSNDAAMDQSSTSVPLPSGLQPLSSSAGEESSMSQADMGISTAEIAENEESVEPKVKIEEETESENPLVEVKKESPIKALLKHEEQSEDEVEMAVTPSASFVSVDDEVSIKEEPLSPSSSISSRLSETGGVSSSRKIRKASRSRGGRRSNQKLTRKSVTEEDRKDDVSSRASDAETTDDERDELSMSANLGQGAFSESIPNSPLSHCSDTEDEKSYKAWKKSIMLVWRAAANHKYANVFLHPVTDDIAPGYGSIVLRPIDLSTVKKNIENGVIRTTQELQRDMMLMFTNAVMYNSSNHDVFKMAVEMYDDVMEHIEQYVSTQLMVQSSEVKLLRHIRRNESSDKEEETRRRRTSSEATEGGKAKKRKSRTEDT